MARSASAEPSPAYLCGHERHVGTCPACQQRAIDRARDEVATATRLAAVAAAAAAR